MRPADRLFLVCSSIKETVAEYYATQDIPDGLELPTRQQVTAGAPAWDCEMLAVWVARTGPIVADVTRTQPDPLFGSVGSMMRNATVMVTIVRCSPQIIWNEEGTEVITWPAPEEEEEAARLVYCDEVLVPNAIKWGSTDAGGNTLPRTNDWSVGEWKVIGPEGGFVASEHTLTIGTEWDPS